MRERLPNHEQETRLAEEKLTLEIKTHSDLYFQALDGNDPSISKLHTLPKGIKKLLDYNSYNTFFINQNLPLSFQAKKLKFERAKRAKPLSTQVEIITLLLSHYGYKGTKSGKIVVQEATKGYLITVQHLLNVHNGKLHFIWLTKKDNLMLLNGW